MTDRARGRREPAPRSVRRATWAIVPMALLVEGEVILPDLVRSLEAHFLHVAFASGAFVAFGIYAVMDVRRNGWPRFTWRIKDRGKAPKGP